MSDGDKDSKQDPVQDQVAAATNGALQGALNTLSAAAVERDRILDQFRDQKERLEFQLQQQRAQAMHYVEQTRAETQQRTGAPSGQVPTGAAETGDAAGLHLSPDQQFIAGVKMLIYQDTRPYEVSTQTQTQSALLLLDALKKMIHQEINVLFERAQAAENARQDAAREPAAQEASTTDEAPPAASAGPPGSGDQPPVASDAPETKPAGKTGTSKPKASRTPDGSSSGP